MRTQRPVLGTCLGIAYIAMVSGCAAFSDHDSGDSTARLAQPPGTRVSRDVALASHEESVGDEAEDKSLSLGDFAPSKIGTTVKQLSGYGPNHELARQLYREAEETYGQAVAARGENPEAEPSAEARQLFLEASDKFASAAARWPDSAMEEDALFRAGESQFFADRYVKANDFFEQLLKKYPNSRYLDLVGARRFLIAKFWLKLDSEQATYPFGLNVTDKGRPWSDTFGHAIRVYDRMRIDDPTGKLADDATLAAANAYFLKGDFVKADQYYSDLRTHFPSSEHQFMAHFLGVQAKLRGYRGPQYTGDALEQAEKLVKQIRRQFPKEMQEHQEELERAYREIRYRLAEREWIMAQFYIRQHEFGAARFYYDIIVDQYGDTPFAAKAREQVGDIAGKPPSPPQRLAWLVDLFPETATPHPIMATAPEDTKRR